MNRSLAVAVLLPYAFSSFLARAQQTFFLTVEPGVQLEVLDWGGAGRSIVLLAGFGHTAHIFDNIAPELRSATHHVYGITRRGFGFSSHPESGYTMQRLADDVLAVVDTLRLERPVLVGHTIAGQEMSLLASQHRKRLGGLVYLDAADPDLPARLKDRTLQKLTQALPAPEPTPADRESFGGLQAWYGRVFGVTPPESELRNCYYAKPDGGVGNWRGRAGVWEAVSESARRADYLSIEVPALALFAAQRSARDVAPWLETKDAMRLAALDEAYEYAVKERALAKKAFLTGAGNRRVLELRGADHYLFLSNEADVLREVRRFLSTLP